MPTINHFDDTISAISTAAAPGGIGIVRLSGPDALKIAESIFKTRSNKKPSRLKTHTVHYGWVIDKNKDVLDEGLLTLMRAPRSYTKEDVVEISCHGGIVVLREVLHLTLEYGARLAEPGEFTKRAFLNGRIDLAQAEAVLDIIQSKTDAFLKVSTHQLKGDLSVELARIREGLMNVYTQAEAIINFPEDDIDAKGRAQLLTDIEKEEARVKTLLESSNQGRILKEGIKLVLCGKPNVGKSSLLNVFLKQPRAIVTDIPGTTRDTIEETAQIRGVPFQLVDTAGILKPRDLVEEEAIKRSHMHMDAADLILFVLDASRQLSKEDEDLIEKIKGKNVLSVLNKCDLKKKIEEERIKKIFDGKNVFKVSALRREGVDALAEAVLKRAGHTHAIDTGALLVSNARHIEALKKCQECIGKARGNLKDGLSLEFISEDVKAAARYLDQITGRDIDVDLLDKIFAEFCIGK